jgi:hypothetical protein
LWKCLMICVIWLNGFSWSPFILRLGILFIIIHAKNRVKWKIRSWECYINAQFTTAFCFSCFSKSVNIKHNAVVSSLVFSQHENEWWYV